MARRSLLGRCFWTMLLLALVASAVVPAVAPAERFVYVSNGASNNVSALRINPDGSLTAVSGSPYTPAPAQTVTEGISITPDAKHVYLAHFGTQGLSAWNVRADGGLDPAGLFATGAATGPLGSSPSPDGSRLYHLNHASKTIGVENIGAGGGLSAILGSPFPAKNSAPYPVIMAPDGRHIYVPNENSGADSNTVTGYTLLATGQPAELQTIATGTNPFGGAITPDGRFVYVSNPEDNAAVGTVSGFSRAANGTLSPVPGTSFSVAPLGGSHPLNIAIAPDGGTLYVATRLSNSVSVFRINADGSLTMIQNAPTGAGNNGKGVALTPDGKRLYVANNTAPAGTVSGFNVTPAGTLTAIPGTPWATGGNAPDLESIAITPNQPPAASFTPQARAVGQASSFNGSSSSDIDGTVARFDWDFGDGTSLPNGGPTPAHVYSQPGTYLVALRLTDDEGCSEQRIFTGKAMLCNGSGVAATTRSITVPAAAPATPPATPPSSTAPAGPDGTAPVIESASADPGRFGVDKRGPAEASAGAVAKGTTIRYSLSEAARVVFTVDGQTKGRRVKKVCKKATRRNRKGKRCTILDRAGSFAKDSDEGANIKRFSGKIGGKTLKPGSYQLTLDATDAAGNRAVPRVLTFKVVRR